MREAHFEEIKQAKTFYVRTFRRALWGVVVSLVMNVLLVLLIFYTHFNQPMRDYYATNGVSAPVRLTAMDKPNDSNEALLAPDPVNHQPTKAIPR